MRRGAYRKAQCKLVNFWMPCVLLPALDHGVVSLDLDRSKFIRRAIREKLERHGLPVDKPARSES